MPARRACRRHALLWARWPLRRQLGHQLEVPVKNLVLDIVRVCGSATSLPEDHPERDVLLQIQAFTRDLDVQLGVSPQLESCVAPSLAMSKDAAAERASQPAQRDGLAH